LAYNRLVANTGLSFSAHVYNWSRPDAAPQVIVNLRYSTILLAFVG